MEHISAHDVRDRLGMVQAIDALQAAIGARGFADTPQRLHLGDGQQDLLVMPAMDDGWAGTKFVSLDRDNPARGLPFVQGLYTLLGPPGLQPLATIDAPALTGIRTAAVSGLATRLLARPDATRLVVIGSGVQARSHVEAMAAVRDLEEVVVVGRRPEAAAAFAEDVAAVHDVPVRVGSPEDVAVADLICVCTSSRTPVFPGASLPPGVHVNAVGSFRPDVQEVDTTTVTTSRVVVEVRAAALSEKGDLVMARERAGWDPATIVADLTELVRGERVGRRAPEDRTLFASVGHAFEDLVVARALVG
jgi:ornithine cyclodeaminase/alanine dehydrogenase-like protein (mu-crystallin family)